MRSRVQLPTTFFLYSCRFFVMYTYVLGNKARVIPRSVSKNGADRQRFWNLWNTCLHFWAFATRHAKHGSNLNDCALDKTGLKLTTTERIWLKIRTVCMVTSTRLLPQSLYCMCWLPRSTTSTSSRDLIECVRISALGMTAVTPPLSAVDTKQKSIHLANSKTAGRTLKSICARNDKIWKFHQPRSVKECEFVTKAR